MSEFLWTLVPFLVPLLLLSVYSVGLILHKAASLRRSGPLGPSDFTKVLDSVSRRERPEALPEHHPLAYLIAHVQEGPHMLQARAQEMVAALEDRITYFPALANVATLTGLFGTVCGMIGAFLSLKNGGGADPSSLAGGLGTALVATALGLITAIPSLAAHAVFQKKVQATTAQMEALLSALLQGRREPGA